MRRNEGEMSADAEFAGLAREYLDDRAERHPDIATGLGDHRFDARLADPSAQALDEERRALDGYGAQPDGARGHLRPSCPPTTSGTARSRTWRTTCGRPSPA